MSRSKLRSAAPPAAHDTPDTLHGAFDGVTDRLAFGWALDAARPGPVRVELLVDQVVVASGMASLERPDIASHGRIIGGFSIALPDDLDDRSSHLVSARIRGTDWLLPGGPHLVSAKRQVAASRFVITADCVTGTITGSAAMPRLALEIDGELVGPVAAVLANADSLPARWTFRHELPASCQDGLAHIIRLRHGETWLPAGDGQATEWHFVSKLRGQIEAIEEGMIRGWAYAPARPDARLTLSLHHDGQWLRDFQTEMLREDVNEEHGITGTHGFSIAVPDHLHDGASHHLQVFAGDVELSGGHAAAPIVLDPAQRPIAALMRGRLETATAQMVGGWACNIASDAPVTVAISVDDRVVGLVVADRHEARLRGITANGGHGAFQFALPAAVMNGRMRSVAARIVGATADLEGSGAHVLFPLVALPAPKVPTLPGKPEAPRHAAADASDPGRVALIVVTWNGAALLDAMLGSVRAHLQALDCQVVIIDHGSTDDTEAVIARHQDAMNIVLRQRRANFSFAESNNLAASFVDAETLVFLNNDIVLTYDCITPLVARLRRERDIGVLGLRLLEPLPAGGGDVAYVPHHDGILFRPRRLADGAIAYMPHEATEAVPTALAHPQDRPAVTAALMACRREEFLAMGGFDPAYSYGLDDVALCLAYRRRLGLRVVCDSAQFAIHARSATRDRKTSEIVDEHARRIEIAASRNIRRLQSTEGTSITWQVLRGLVEGTAPWRERPLRVTFAVTETTMHTGAGDYFTALELGTALRDEFGWEVMFVRNDQTALAGTDLLVAMRHDYPIRAVTDANPGCIAIAWARNRIDEWIGSGNLECYALLFASSRKACAALAEATGRMVACLPIATNPDRFHPRADGAAPQHDLVFTGHRWADARDAVEALGTPPAGLDFRIFGRNWDRYPQWREYAAGPVPYYQLPEIYADTKIVLDDSHPVTRDWNSVNSRVFDALASGALPITNCAGGAEELFGKLLPSFSTADELQTQIADFLADKETREIVVRDLRDEVLAKHTYRHRAHALRHELGRFLGSRLRIAIKIAVPSRDQQEYWGDTHFARGLQRAFIRLGHHARIDLLPEWNADLGAGDDVAIVLRGLSEYRPSGHAVQLAWLISHPDEVSLAELEDFHHVFVASSSYTAKLRPRLGDAVSTLLQCTELHDAVPHGTGAASGEFLYVANSRGVRRIFAEWSLEADIPLAIHGSGWAGFAPPAMIRSSYLPNAALKAEYARATAVLCDHWPDMAAEGFLSNRLFDAAAAGATIISDDVLGLRDVLGPEVMIARDRAEFAACIRAAQAASPAERARRAAALQHIVAASHGFEHRARQILHTIRPLLPQSVTIEDCDSIALAHAAD